MKVFPITSAVNLRRVLICAVSGVVVSLILWVVWPSRYVSNTVVRFRFTPTSTPVKEESARKVESYMATLDQTFPRDKELQSFVHSHGLDQKKSRANWDIRRVATTESYRGPCIYCWVLSFEANDDTLSQEGAQELANALFLDSQYFHPIFPPIICPPAADCDGDGFELLDPATLGRRMRPPFWQLGLAGFAAGALLSVITQRRRPIAN